MGASRVITVGALAPLTRPGLVGAGLDLRDGFELAVDDINRSKLLAAELRLDVRDTRGDGEAAVAALDDLMLKGIRAVVGEFHSVVARRAAQRADEIGMPFVCASATLDEVTARGHRSVFRLAPPQSHGWRIFAEVLIRAGHRHVALLIDPDVYWSAGAAIVDASLRRSEVRVTWVEVERDDSGTALHRLGALHARSPVDAVLLLVGYPAPLAALLAHIRREPAFRDVLVCDPAGRAAFPDWWDIVGADGVGVPYLEYLPEQPTAKGRDVAARFSERYGREPTFVALEGHDSVVVIAEAIATAGADADRAAVVDALTEVSVEGTRGLIRFGDGDGARHHQWVWPPVRVVAAPFNGALPSQVASV